MLIFDTTNSYRYGNKKFIINCEAAIIKNALRKCDLDGIYKIASA